MTYRIGKGQHFSKPAWTLSEVLQNTTQAEAPARSLIGKIDVQSSEGPALASAEVSTLSNFTKLIVESSRVEQHAKYPKTMRQLLFHGNSWRNKIEMSGFPLLDVVEVT